MKAYELVEQYGNGLVGKKIKTVEGAVLTVDKIESDIDEESSFYADCLEIYVDDNVELVSDNMTTEISFEHKTMQIKKVYSSAQKPIENVIILIKTSAYPSNNNIAIGYYNNQQWHICYFDAVDVVFKKDIIVKDNEIIEWSYLPV